MLKSNYSSRISLKRRIATSWINEVRQSMMSQKATAPPILLYNSVQENHKDKVKKEKKV
jgi:hypothetical protein